MDASITRRRVVVHGLVQGVFFRANVRDRARGLGLTGSVRNCRDGTVEAVFEGPEEAVDAAVAFCSVGPRSAIVDHADVYDEDPRGEVGFSIR